MHRYSFRNSPRDIAPDSALAARLVLAKTITPPASRLLPPLVITGEEIDKGLEIMARGMK
mgnify:CR=1 FL=1